MEGLSEEHGSGVGARVLVVGLDRVAAQRCEEELGGLPVVRSSAGPQRLYFPVRAFAPAPASVSASLAMMVSAAGCSSSRRENASFDG